MAGIKSVQVKTPTGETKRVQVGSEAYNKYTSQGSTAVSGSGKNLTPRDIKDVQGEYSDFADEVSTTAAKREARAEGKLLPYQELDGQAPAVEPQKMEEQAQIAPFEEDVTTNPAAVRDQAVAQIQSGDVQSGAQTGTAPIGPSNKFMQGYQAATTAGTAAPANNAQGRALVQQYLPPEPERQMASELLTTDPYIAELQKAYQDYYTPRNQKDSLAKLYKQMVSDSGIEDIDMELIDMKNVIEGTEEDIRTEITKAGGFATNSQVLALSNARNKQLIKNYNTLLDTRNAKEKYLDTMMSLTVQDRERADRQFDSMMNFGFQVAQFQQQAKQNAIAQYNTLAANVGYDGLMSMTNGDPYSISLIERTMGLSSGGLQQLSNMSAHKRAMEEQEHALDIAYKQAQINDIRNRISRPDVVTIDGKSAMWNPQTGQFEPINLGGGGDTMQLAQSQNKISETSKLIQSKGLDSVVGTTIFSRGAGGFGGVVGRFLAGAAVGGAAGAAAGAPFAVVGAIPGAIIGAVAGGVIAAGQGAKDTITGERQDFIAGVEQLRSGLNLDTLIQAKANGATFGALSNQELQVLASSATKLGTWAIVDKNGRVLGYNTSEKNFRTEMDKINNYAKLDAVLKGANPADVGVTVMPDGSYWAQNSDGSVTRIR